MPFFTWRGSRSTMRGYANDVQRLALTALLAAFMGAAVSAGQQPTGDHAPLKVSVTENGQTRQIESATAKTVGELLAEQKIILGKLDRCSSSLPTALADGMQIVVTRVRVEQVVERAPIPFPTAQKYSSALRVGMKKIVQAGKPGIKATTYRDTFKDGARVARKKLSEKTVPPRKAIVMTGTRGMTLASRGFFGGRRILEMSATGYGPNRNGHWSARCATGLKPGKGVVAVDPRFIPLGTRLFIEGYGYAVAGDTGGAIKGNRIDLGMDSHHEAMAVGRRKVRVLILN